MTTSTKRNFKKGALMVGAAVVTLTGVAAVQQAQAITVNGAGNLNAVIANVPTVTEQTALHFGSIGAGGVADTVIISPAGARSTGGGNAVLVTGGGATPAQGVMRINNPPAATTITYAVTAAASVTGPGPAMVVNTFVLDDGNGVGNTTSVTAAITQVDVNVGATLAVADSATQTVGAYTGTYTLNVTY